MFCLFLFESLRGKIMTVKELMEMLSECNPNSTIDIVIERGRGSSLSDDVSVCEYDNVVTLSGEETGYD